MRFFFNQAANLHLSHVFTTLKLSFMATTGDVQTRTIYGKSNEVFVKVAMSLASCLLESVCNEF